MEANVILWDTANTEKGTNANPVIVSESTYDAARQGATLISFSIAYNTATSSAIDLMGYEIAGIQMPAAINGTSLTFQTSTAAAGTYQNLYDDSGSEVTLTVGTPRNISVNANAVNLMPWQYVKVRMGTAASPATQPATYTWYLVMK